MISQLTSRLVSRAPFGSVRLLIVAIAFSALLGGCATTTAPVPPDVTLVGLEIVEATLFESTFSVDVRIFNENPEPLLLDGAVVKLELEGRRFGKGAIGERVEIPRFDSVVQRLEMHLSHVAIASKIRGVIESRTVNYAITGKVYVVTPSGSIRRLPIDKRGTIDLSGGAPLELENEAAVPSAVDD